MVMSLYVIILFISSKRSNHGDTTCAIGSSTYVVCTRSTSSSTMVSIGAGSYQISVLAQTERSVVYSSLICNCVVFCFPSSGVLLGGEKISIFGVLMVLATLIISLRRGTPNVTFFEDTPA